MTIVLYLRTVRTDWRVFVVIGKMHFTSDVGSKNTGMLQLLQILIKVENVSGQRFPSTTTILDFSIRYDSLVIISDVIEESTVVSAMAAIKSPSYEWIAE